MNFLIENAEPVLPCICGHRIIAHGEVEEVAGQWQWDDDHKEEVWQEELYPRPVCFDCGPYDCIFQEMTNLEYLEWKSEDKNKCP
jgi:hypothetical protein